MAGQHLLSGPLVEPAPAKKHFARRPTPVSTGLPTAMCGNCAYAHFFTEYQAEMLAAHKPGYLSCPFMTEIEPAASRSRFSG